MNLLDSVANVATVLTILSFLTGTSICRSIYQARSTSEFSSLPFLVGALCGYLWLRYGLLLSDSTMIFVNSIGLFLQSIYLIWFQIFTAHKYHINRRILMLSSFFLFVHLYIIFSPDPEYLVGSLACFSSMFFCASPLPLVWDSIKLKSTERLPFSLIFSSFLVTLMWFAYGYMIENSFVQLPNAVGAIISGLQLSLFVIYPPKSDYEAKALVN